MTTWLELKHGDVLVEYDSRIRALDYSVLLILNPPLVDDPTNRIEYVSLVNGAHHDESMINPHGDVEREWHLMRSP